ncbi:MAG: hypothetical protein HN590_10515, partial [Calditrichaeota bacterium]|nr:hypothetical protein [Calditrichota bacterium]
STEVGVYFRGYVGGYRNTTDSVLYNRTVAISGTYGYSRNAEFSFSQVIYQDYNETLGTDENDDGFMIPGDITLSMKYGNIRVARNTFIGFMPSLTYGISEYTDIQFEPYSNESLEYDLTAMVSYYDKPLFPDEGLSVHGNVGFHYYNDDSRGDDKSTTSLSWLVSTLVPFKKLPFDLGLEVYGLNYLDSPGWDVLSREDWIYVTPMIRTQAYYGVRYTFGVDVLVLGDEDTTIPPDGMDMSEYYNYPTWRFTTRINFVPPMPSVVGLGLPSQLDRPVYTASQGLVDTRYDMFKWAIDDEGKQVSSVDVDLEKIRQERLNAERELERLKIQLRQRQGR